MKQIVLIPHNFYPDVLPTMNKYFLKRDFPIEFITSRGRQYIVFDFQCSKVCNFSCTNATHAKLICKVLPPPAMTNYDGLNLLELYDCKTRIVIFLDVLCPVGELSRINSIYRTLLSDNPHSDTQRIQTTVSNLLLAFMV